MSGEANTSEPRAGGTSTPPPASTPSSPWPSIIIAIVGVIGSIAVAFITAGEKTKSKFDDEIKVKSTTIGELTDKIDSLKNNVALYESLSLSVPQVWLFCDPANGPDSKDWIKAQKNVRSVSFHASRTFTIEYDGLFDSSNYIVSVCGMHQVSDKLSDEKGFANVVVEKQSMKSGSINIAVASNDKQRQAFWFVTFGKFKSASLLAK